MSSIPSAEGFDSTLTLLRNPYGFISQTCRALDTDLFETRILLQKTICMTGSAAAEVFYSDDKLIRAGSMPGRIQRPCWVKAAFRDWTALPTSTARRCSCR